MKHGTTNATIQDQEKVDTITLEEAVELLAEKFGAPVKKKPVKKATKVAASAKAKSTATPAVAPIKKRKKAA